MKKCKCGRKGLVHCSSDNCDIRICTVCKRAFCSTDAVYEGPVTPVDGGFRLKSDSPSSGNYV